MLVALACRAFALRIRRLAFGVSAFLCSSLTRQASRFGALGWAAASLNGAIRSVPLWTLGDLWLGLRPKQSRKQKTNQHNMSCVLVLHDTCLDPYMCSRVLCRLH